MPAKNRIKPYIENGYYHIYNRGVNKRLIFKDKKDCIVFQRFLKQYLSPKDDLKEFMRPGERLDRLMKTNMHGELEILAFALMPNHFHLLVRQKKPEAIIKFMRRLCTSYSMYINRKYQRVGHLFQDAYKGVLVLDDQYLLHLSRYIHLNPDALDSGMINFREFNSYPYYLGEQSAKWVNTKYILKYFRNEKVGNHNGSYENFIEDYRKSSTKNFLIGLALDDDDVV
ncbi:MAG TPA: transposase [Patescibacteria group bacterium]|nr:transposase [Patescibacteria group bacterium]